MIKKISIVLLVLISINANAYDISSLKQEIQEQKEALLECRKEFADLINAAKESGELRSDFELDESFSTLYGGLYNKDAKHWQLIEQAKELVSNCKEAALSSLGAVKSWAKKNPDLAVMAAITTAGLALLAFDRGNGWWQDNHKEINSNSIRKINALVRTLGSDSCSFSFKDNAYKELKKYTRYQKDYEEIYYCLHAKNGILATYNQYKKSFFDKVAFKKSLAHIDTELNVAYS